MFVVTVFVLLASTSATAQNTASVTNVDPLEGSYSFKLDLNRGGNQVYVLDESPDGEEVYRVKFLFKRNGMAFDNLRDRGSIFVARQQLPDNSWRTIMRVLVINTVNFGYVGRTAVRKNDDYSAPWQNCGDWGWPDATGPASVREVVVEWKAATAPGANDGYCRTTVNGDVKATVSTIDNDERWVDQVWMGLIEGNLGRATGEPMFDSFESYRTLSP
jgi:hypothetical protein